MFGSWEQKQIVALAVGVGLFVLSWTILLLVKRLIWRRLRAYAEKSPQTWDDALLVALLWPFHLLSFLIAVAIGIHSLPNRFQALPLVAQGMKIAFVLLGAWTFDRVLGVFISHSGTVSKFSRGGRVFLQNAFRFVTFSIVFLIVLDTLGISITPLLASLGVGSVAVALALQDTLGNLFSGVYILVDRPVRLGDYVRLDAGIEGYVRDIGWRSTRLELLTNNMVVIPNSKLSSAILTNFNLPVVWCQVKVEVGVSYDADLVAVEKVVFELAKSIQSHPSGVADFTPTIRFTHLGDSSITLATSLQAKSYADTFPLRHEFIKLLHSEFKKRGIEIPYPQRVVRSVTD